MAEDYALVSRSGFAFVCSIRERGVCRNKGVPLDDGIRSSTAYIGWAHLRHKEQESETPPCSETQVDPQKPRGEGH